MSSFTLFESGHCFQCIRYIDYLQKQAKPTEIELADDEFILHVEGSAQTQKVVRHIGASSWPGSLLYPILFKRVYYF